jgi:hypothetical protein
MTIQRIEQMRSRSADGRPLEAGAQSAEPSPTDQRLAKPVRTSYLQAAPRDLLLN